MSPLKPLAQNLRRNATEAERKLWKDLRTFKRRGHHFRRQAPIGKYIVDFVCHKSRLIIELDGGHHSGEEQEKKDKIRQDWLESQGYVVMRFWNNDIYEQQDWIINFILDKLETSPHPQPLPIQGRGDNEAPPHSCNSGKPEMHTGRELRKPSQ